VTPRELERLGIAITGSTNWIGPLAIMMGLKERIVYAWWTGKTRITAPKQSKLLLLAGQPDGPLVPIFDDTRNRLARIMAMREQGYTYESIGQELGITRQAVRDMAARYRLLKPRVEQDRLQCPICSTTFQPITRRQKCCSHHCGSIRWRLLNRAVCFCPKPCEECGTMFQPKTSRGRFCRQRCRYRHQCRAYQRRLRARAAA